MHGQMHYMERSRDIRDQPSSLLPQAQTIIALTSSYHRPQEPIDLGKVARYAQGYDYHKVLEFRLDQLAAFIHAETGVQVQSRASVDRLPVLERDIAYVAGLGWYGKNTMMMNRTHGSYFFLAELLVDLDLEVSTGQHKQFCGTCTACLDSCPTGAFVSPWVLDARRCISYLTIELRGPIPRGLRPLIGDHLFGCDICQSVCPWNRKAPHTQTFAFLGRPEVTSLNAAELLTWTPDDFRHRLTLSPIQRARRPGLLRNAAVVLGNTADRQWVPDLLRCLEEEAEPLVRGHAAWALGRLGGQRARLGLERRLGLEQDTYVLEEIRAALQESQASLVI
jgi:epoxyqueuosine reductase